MWILALEDGGEIGGSRVYFPSAPVKGLADLRNRANSQRYSSICEDQRPKIVQDIEKSMVRRVLKDNKVPGASTGTRVAEAHCWGRRVCCRILGTARLGCVRGQVLVWTGGLE